MATPKWIVWTPVPIVIVGGTLAIMAAWPEAPPAKSVEAAPVAAAAIVQPPAPLPSPPMVAPAPKPPVAPKRTSDPVRTEPPPRSNPALQSPAYASPQVEPPKPSAPPPRRMLTPAERRQLIDVQELRVGKAGKLKLEETLYRYQRTGPASAEAVPVKVQHTPHVRQIIDDQNMLIDITIITAIQDSGRADWKVSNLIWVRGFSTAGLADDDKLDLTNVVFIVADPQAYDSMSGRRTVSCLEVVP